MNAVLKLLFFCLFLSWTEACHQLTNHTEKTALDCGISQREAGEHDYLRILDTDGVTPLGSSQGLRVKFLDTKTQSQVPLRLTRGLCVQLPDRSGTVLISQAEPKAGTVFHYSPSLWGFQNPTIHLSESPKITASVSCANDGIFANDELASPFQFEVRGSLKPIQLRVIARDISTKSETVLFMKPWGQDHLHSSSVFKLGALAEGVYTLEARVNDLGDGFDVTDRYLTETSSCLLTVIRSTPLISRAFKDQEGSGRVPTFKLGEKLPWSMTSVNQELFVCSEIHSGTPNDATCRPQSHCRDLNAFKQVLAAEAKEVGLFDYFVFVKDRAGNRGALDCQTVAVSENAPLLDLSWKKKPWNTDGGELMELPYAVLEAEATLAHPIVSNDELKDNLECKVDFLLQGRDALKGDKVTCLSDRCQGQSLGDFIPCSPSLRFDISRAWEQKSIALAQIRLTMRTEDGAGHQTSKTIGVWLNSSRWPIEKVSYDRLPMISTPWTIATDNQGQILAFQNNSDSFLVNDGTWTLTQASGEPNTQLHNPLQYADGEIYANGSQIAADANNRQTPGTYRWTGIHWEKDLSLQNIMGHGACTRLFRSNSSQLLCGLTNVDEIVRTLAFKQGDAWTVVAAPFDLNPDGNYHVLQAKDGRLWVLQNNQAFYKARHSSTWQKTKVENFSKVEEDRFGNIWLILETGIAKYNILQLFTGEHFERVELPPSTHPLRDTLEINARQDLVYGGYRWSNPDRSWDPLPFPSEFAARKADYYPFFDNRGEIWWLDQLGLMGQLNGQYVHIPLSLSGLSCFDEGNRCGVIRSGPTSLTLTALKLKNFEYATYVLKLQDLAIFDSESLGLPSTKEIDRVWTNPDQTKELSFAEIAAPSYSFKKGVWSPASVIRLPTRYYQMNRAPDDTLLATSATTVYASRKDGPWTPIASSSIGEWQVIREPFLNFGDASIFRMADSWDVWVARGSQIERISDGPQDAQLLVVGPSLWGRDGHGLNQYRDLSFQKVRSIDYQSLGFTADDIADVFVSGAESLLFKIRTQAGHRYAIVDLKTGKGEGWAFPFEAPTEAYHVMGRSDGSFIVKTNWDVYLKSKNGWQPLLTGDELEKMGYIRGVNTLFLDLFDRLWMHQTGAFFRLDLQRPQTILE